MRPSTLAFLEALAKSGYQVVACSSGVKELIAQAMNALGITDCFTAIIDGDDLDEMRWNQRLSLRRWVLVDDHDLVNHSGGRVKLFCLGLYAEATRADIDCAAPNSAREAWLEQSEPRYVQCKSWNGGEEDWDTDTKDGSDPEPLTDLISQIETKLATLA